MRRTHSHNSYSHGSGSRYGAIQLLAPGSGPPSWRVGRPRRPLQISVGLVSMVLATFLWFGASATVAAHPGGTDEYGCHAGGQPRHCDNGVDPASATVPESTAAGAPESTTPIVEAPQAGAPDTTAPPVLPAPVQEDPAAQVPPPAPTPEVLGTQETQQPKDSLAHTGLTEDSYYLALGLLLLGFLLVTTSGFVGYLPQPLKGGLTYHTLDRGGDPVVIRSTTGH